MVINSCDACFLVANAGRPIIIFSRYPYNLEFDYGALDGLNKYSINNLGDPFIESNYVSTNPVLACMRTVCAVVVCAHYTSPLTCGDYITLLPRARSCIPHLILALVISPEH